MHYVSKCILLHTMRLNCHQSCCMISASHTTVYWQIYIGKMNLCWKDYPVLTYCCISLILRFLRIDTSTKQRGFPAVHLFLICCRQLQLLVIFVNVSAMNNKNENFTHFVLQLPRSVLNSTKRTPNCITVIVNFILSHQTKRSHSSHRPSINIEECKLVTSAHKARFNVTHFQIVNRKHVLFVFLLQNIIYW